MPQDETMMLPGGPLGMENSSMPTPPKQDSSPDEGDSEVVSKRARVKEWLKKIDKARKKWEPDFERMRDNMDFVAGIQWPGQKTIKYDKYICNLTLRAVNQGVATLYARNPRVEARRRQRLDFQLWDGHMETVQQAVIQATVLGQMGVMVPPEIMALLTDYQQGRQRQQLIDKIGKTLEIVYQYQMDTQQPRFKTQMKQLVRRVRVCGVGYIKVLFCRDYESELTQSETRVSAVDRAKVASNILEKLKEGKIEETDAEVEKLRSLVASLGTTPLDAESANVKEHLIFDFPKATSIIPDADCRMLKGFVGAHWIAEDFFYPLDFINSFFELRGDKAVKPSSELRTSSQGDKFEETNLGNGEKQDEEKKKVRITQVYDIDTKSSFIACDGYKDYIVEPEPVESGKGFWNTFPVTFNDIEVEDGCKATIFPPSDVDLLRPIQIARNRARHALNRHRKANGPKYMYAAGTLEEADLDKIEDAEDQQFIELKSVQPGTEPNKVLQPLETVDIKPELYDTNPYEEDAAFAAGTQEANMGPAQPNVTATVGSIAEQSRQTVAGSDVDGLDDSLTDVAQYGGELLFKEMSGETVRKIAGVGAVWPEQNKQDFVNEIELEVVAASSGRPNKVVEIQNWQQLAPLIMQAAQMPPQMQPTIQAVIRESVKRIDDRLDPADFFPLPVPQMPQEPSTQGEAPAGGQQQQSGQPNTRRSPKANRNVGPRPATPGTVQPPAGNF